MARRSILKILLLVIAAIVAIALLMPHRTSSIDSLVSDFPEQVHELNQIYELLADLRESDGIKGIVMVGDKERLNMSDGSQMFVLEALFHKSDPESIKRLEAVMRNLDADYANLGKKNSLWIVMDSGGVLGSDFGYLYFEGDPKEFTYLNKFNKIPGEKYWFAVVY